jgi:hypothetical protein
MGNASFKTPQAASDEQWYSRLEQDREVGHALLRDPAVKANDAEWRDAMQKEVMQEKECLRKSDHARFKRKVPPRKQALLDQGSNVDTMSRDHDAGLVLMRNIMAKSDHMEWELIFAQADFLGEHEQSRLKQRERHWRRKELARALDRQKRYGAGPHSVNKLAASLSEDETGFVKRLRDYRLNASHSDTASCSSLEDQANDYESRGYDTELLLDRASRKTNPQTRGTRTEPSQRMGMS